MSELPTMPGIEVRNVNQVHVGWRGAHRFDAERPGAPAFRVDADGKEGPGPVDTLLVALATCTAVDVVDILTKRRTPAATLEVDVDGARAKATPARLIGVLLRYRITGDGVERLHAERAIELAVTKYCSVRNSLDRSLPISWTLELNGEAGELRRESENAGQAEGAALEPRL